MLFLFEMAAVLASVKKSTNDKFSEQTFKKCRLLAGGYSSARSRPAGRD
jgi:hypothetical protein